MSDQVLYDNLDGRVAVITINKPERMNSFDNALCRNLVKAVKIAEGDNDVRVAILTGRGKIFSAGGDIGALKNARDPWQKREILDNADRVISTIYNFEKPIIASVNGVAAGAATAMVMACDIVFASHSAKFAPNFINIAALPDTGVSWFLVRRLGCLKAYEILANGSSLTPEEAQRYGLYNRVMDNDLLLKETILMAQRLAQKPAAALKMLKKLLRESPSNSLDKQLELEASYQLLAWSHSDFKEGVSAFMEKRKPKFNKA